MGKSNSPVLKPGHKHLWATLHEDDLRDVRIAAAIEGVRATDFIRKAAVKVARDVCRSKKPMLEDVEPK